ncbi:unnamed protein product [Durusdinium trenchii]|uniref:LAGLIDADG endonuclease n=1 Tax=Durusdinium trenchii TaxID=1381693 RepID=A0ABP0M6H2_9DINO
MSCWDRLGLQLFRRAYLSRKAVAPPQGCLTEKQIEYLIGFFDGDGCVTMNKSTGRMSLKVSQTLDSATVLMRLRDSLGGGIYREKCQTGAHKAVLQWVVSGKTMQHAARVLCQVPSIKHAQLQIAATGNIAMTDRSEVAQKLTLFKQKGHTPTDFQCSWPYFAGFFDAEGSITLPKRSVGLQLEVGQLNDFVLEKLFCFLHLQKLIRWRLYRRDHVSKLSCTDFATCKLTLKRLLEAGLDVKQRQAALALSLTADNHVQVREAKSELNGLQSKYERLDDAGIDRAKEIKRIGAQWHRASSQQERELLQVKLEGLREEHKLQKLITKTVRLRGSIRQSLREGGLIRRMS